MPDRSRLTLLIVGAAALLGLVAVVDAFRSSDGETAASTTTQSDEVDTVPERPPPPIQRMEASEFRTHTRTVDRVRFSFRVETAGWERFRVSMNKSIVGPQGAEAIIYWASFPDRSEAELCSEVLSARVGPSAADVADAVAEAPGTELVSGPLDVFIDGRVAKHVVLTVREQVGCQPGFFYGWQAEEVGAVWQTQVGDTIRVWIVEVHGKRLFIEVETSTESDALLNTEVVRIVESIRFN